MALASVPTKSDAQSHPTLNLSRLGQLLFMAFAVYLVLPIIDVPLLGLSLSAPMLFLVALELFLKPQGYSLSHYGGWFAWGYIFWMGLFFSLTINVIAGNINSFDSYSVITLIRYVYWILALIITVIMVSRLPQQQFIRLGIILSVGVLILGALRMGEAIFFGRWGAWTGPRLLSQNAYGIQFSIFTPFALALVFYTSGVRRWLSIGGFMLLLAAVMGNGSRSSWVAVAAGVLVFSAVYLLTQRQSIGRYARIALVMISLIMLLVVILPESVFEPIYQRYDALQNYEDDKSFGVRLLMIQKGLRQFESNPFFGVGIGRFQDEFVELELPGPLQYGSQEHFNIKSSHNSYTQLLGETGLAGIVPFGLFLISLMLRGGKVMLLLAREGQLWAIAIYASFIGMSIHLWTLSGLTGTVVWFIYGLVGATIVRGHASKEAT